MTVPTSAQDEWATKMAAQKAERDASQEPTAMLAMEVGGQQFRVIRVGHRPRERYVLELGEGSTQPADRAVLDEATRLMAAMLGLKIEGGQP